jgi:hypothetical protein
MSAGLKLMRRCRVEAEVRTFRSRPGGGTRHYIFLRRADPDFPGEKLAGDPRQARPQITDCGRPGVNRERRWNQA